MVLVWSKPIPVNNYRPEDILKEKKRKGTLVMFLKFTIRSYSLQEAEVKGRCPKEKKTKRDISDVPIQKKQNSFPNSPFEVIVSGKLRSRRYPKEKK